MPVATPSATQQRARTERRRSSSSSSSVPGSLRTVAALLAVLIFAEGAARWIEPRVPAAVTWGNPFIQAKTAQLEQRRTSTAVIRS